MDDNQQTPVTDDQELANVLAGMNQQAAHTAPSLDDTSAPTTEETAPLETPELHFEEAPVGASTTDEVTPTTDELPPVDAPALDAPAEPVAATEPVAPLEPAAPVTPSDTPSASPELDNIKKEALEQLRPLVDKLDLPADEKFDTLLLMIRSTDDKSLVDATFEAAKAITDETKRAQALLDVIKEIDYFAGQK